MESQAPQPPIDVLLVENNQLLAMKLKKHLLDSGRNCHFHQVRDGIEAVDFLKNRSPHEKAPRPQLVILDVDLPTIDGYQILGIMREREELKRVPTIVIESDSQAKKRRKRIHMLNFSRGAEPSRAPELSSTVEAVSSFLLQALKGQ